MWIKAKLILYLRKMRPPKNVHNRAFTVLKPAKVIAIQTAQIVNRDTKTALTPAPKTALRKKILNQRIDRKNLQEHARMAVPKKHLVKMPNSVRKKPGYMRVGAMTVRMLAVQNAQHEAVDTVHRTARAAAVQALLPAHARRLK